MEDAAGPPRWIHEILDVVLTIITRTPAPKPEELRQLFADVASRLPEPMSPADGVMLDFVVRGLLARLPTLHEGGRSRLKGDDRLVSALGFLHRLGAQTTRSEPDDGQWRLALFHEVLGRHYSNHALRAADVGISLGISASRLSHLLTKHTGHGFRWHLRAHRSQVAAELLSSSALSVKEIAGAVGYLSVSEFDRHFKQTYEMTPSRFRKAMRTLAGKAKRVK